MEVQDAILSRRSIRKYTDDSVAQEDLNALLEAIRWAPSWANTQSWEVIVVTEEEQRAKLAGTFPPKNPGTKTITEAPIVFVFAAKKGVSGYYKDKAVTLYGDWLMFDLGLAMQNLALAAHSRGLGTCDLGYFDHPKVAEILGIPDGLQVIAMTPLGHPAEMPKAPTRKGTNEFVSYESFGQRTRND
jgi:nitroreductase